MTVRIVDVFLHDVRVASYTLALAVVHDPLLEQDLIERARERMAAENFTRDQIAQARFAVRP